MVIKFSNLTNKHIPSCCTYVKRQASAATHEIADGKKYYSYNLKNGWQIGKRLAKQQDYNPLRAFYTRLYSSAVKAKVRRKDIIPAFLGSVGFLVPFPAASVIGFALGKVINKVFSRIK